MKEKKPFCVKSGLWGIFKGSKTGSCRGREEVPECEDLLTESPGAEWTSLIRGPKTPVRVHGGEWNSCFSYSPLQAMGIKTALPAAELGLYSLVLSGALAYAGRGLLEASQGNGMGGVWDRP